MYTITNYNHNKIQPEKNFFFEKRGEGGSEATKTLPHFANAKKPSPPLRPANNSCGASVSRPGHSPAVLKVRARPGSKCEHGLKCEQCGGPAVTGCPLTQQAAQTSPQTTMLFKHTRAKFSYYTRAKFRCSIYPRQLSRYLGFQPHTF